MTYIGTRPGCRHDDLWTMNKFEMTKSDFYAWLHEADWTTKCDIAPVDPNKYLNEFTLPTTHRL